LRKRQIQIKYKRISEMFKKVMKKMEGKSRWTSNVETRLQEINDPKRYDPNYHLGIGR